MSGFGCQEISVFGIRFSVLDTDTSYETLIKQIQRTFAEKSGG
ncbi:hypothetical protein D1AOALGA4SA_2145 [Olavius algarvensis Delta 1 endosymbiont]|nr:hypothetical protein D1AOALGA4SA_2145 [Olavius algarvensis Delta 1 endosymbiont]